MGDPGNGESFEEFRRSFSYGSRNDLNFKFLKTLPDDEAAEFFRTLLDRLGDAYDDGRLQPLIDVAIEAQIAGYAPKPDGPPSRYVYDDGPFAPTRMPVAGSTVGLLTSGGHFIDGADPEPFGVEDMTQEEAIERIDEFLKDRPVLSEISRDHAEESLRTRHGGYDITSAVIDRNVAFPVDRLEEALADGRIGGLTETYFSFPGATAQGRLRRELAGWLDRFAEEQTDVMLLVPV